MVDERLLMAWLRQYRVFGKEAVKSRILRAIRPQIVQLLQEKLHSQLATRALAEELAQEALYKIGSNLEDCRAPTPRSFRAWRRTIVRNVWVDYLRDRGDEMEDRASNRLAEAIRLGLLGPARDQAQEAPSRADRVLGELLFDAQRQLSDDTALVIRRRFLHGDTWREAGAAVGTTAGGARSRWNNAQDRMRRYLRHRIEELPDDLKTELRARLGL